MIEAKFSIGQSEIESGGIRIWVRKSHGIRIGEVVSFDVLDGNKTDRIDDAIGSFAALARFFESHPDDVPKYITGRTHKAVRLLAERIGFETSEDGMVFGETSGVLNEFNRILPVWLGLIERRKIGLGMQHYLE